MAQKYIWIFTCSHHMFWDAISFLRGKVKDNCELWGTDYAWGIFSDIPLFSPSHDLHARKKYDYYFVSSCYSICLRMSGRLIIQTSCRKENCTFWSPSLDLGAIVFQIWFLIFGIILWAGYANAVAETKSVFSAAKNVSLQY